MDLRVFSHHSSSTIAHTGIVFMYNATTIRPNLSQKLPRPKQNYVP